MLDRAFLAAAAAALVAACPAPRPNRPAVGTTHATAPARVDVDAPPSARLGDEVTPRAYRVELDVEPGRNRFRGTVEIDVTLNQPATSLWLHGAELTIESSRLRHAGGELALTPLAAPADRELVGFGFGTTVAAGDATVVIHFAGDMGTTAGIFHQRYQGAWYAFSDFEPIDARRGLPCFDDPRWRTPWTLTLTVPRGMDAYANTPVDRREEIGADRTRVRFLPTPPLPSYLLAFAVGRFEVVGDGDGGAPPVRVLTFPGHSARATRALAAARAILPIASRWVDMPVPWRKVDFVAVPIFEGAMENPGLITVSERILHLDPDDPAPAAERLMVLVIAHEIAHLWFGDLFNMRWWDDLWLNEGFATYLANEWIETWKPDWHWQLERETLRARAYDADSRANARAVRQPVTTHEEIRATFDVMTYIKGGAILEMLEQALGEERFRDRVRAYAKRHAGGTVTTADLARALGSRQIIEDFVERPGVPIIDGARACERGKQAPYRLIGEAATEQRWSVPCVDVGYFLRNPGTPSSEREAMQRLEWVRAQMRRGALTPAAAAAMVDVGVVHGSALERQLQILAELEALVEPAVLAPIAGPITARAMQALGWERRPGERNDDREVRPELIEAFARYHPVPAAVRKRAARWLRDRSGVDDELAPSVLMAVAVRGDRALHDRLVAELDRDNDDDHRDAVLAALASFADPALLGRTLALTVDPRRSRMDALKLLYQALENPHTRAAAYDFLGRAASVLSGQYRTTPLLARFACTAAEVAIANALMADFAASSPQEERMLAQIRDEYQTCKRLRR